MSRTIKRVPLDFRWQLSRVWKGYFNPYYHLKDKDGYFPREDQLYVGQECPHCEGSLGYSDRYRYWEGVWYGSEYFDPVDTGSTPFPATHPVVVGIAMSNEESGDGNDPQVQREARRLAQLFNAQMGHHLSQADVDLLHEKGRLFDYRDKPCPSAKEINERSIADFMLLDSMACWIIAESRCEAEGVSSTCVHCDGKSWLEEDNYDLYIMENWQPVEPPTGDGYQVWETVSEGSPISPVFADRDKMIEWLVDEGYSREGAVSFASIGSVPSMILDVSAGGKPVVYKGIESAVLLDSDEED